MANTFWRQAVEGADDNTWAQYEVAQNRVGIGEYSCRLYDDAGALKLSKGRIGINDNTNEGVSIIDTITTVNMAGIANGNWAEIYMTVAGVVVTIAAVDVAGANDPTIIPAGVKAAYNEEKVGYYLVATRRLLGIAWKTAGGDLGKIINTENGEFGFKNFQLFDYVDKDGTWSKVYITETIIEFAWDMDADNTTDVAYPIYITQLTILDVHGTVLRDDRNSVYPINVSDTSADHTLRFACPAAGNLFRLSRRLASHFDDPAYNDDTIKRGSLTVRHMM